MVIPGLSTKPTKSLVDPIPSTSAPMITMSLKLTGAVPSATTIVISKSMDISRFAFPAVRNGRNDSSFKSAGSSSSIVVNVALIKPVISTNASKPVVISLNLYTSPIVPGTLVSICESLKSNCG